MSDVSGIRRHRRSFLNLQMDIERSRNMDELWGNICTAMEMMHFDRGGLHVNVSGKDAGGVSASMVKAEKIEQPHLAERRQNDGQGRESVTNPLQLKMDTGEADVRIWTRGDYRRGTDTSTRHFLKVEIPLGNDGDLCPARLVLFKDIRRESFQPFTLRRGGTRPPAV